MYTLGTTTKTICKINEDHSINISAVSSVILKKGTVVKLTAEGEVAPVVASTDKPFGTVIAGNREVDDLLTVQTQFSAIIRTTASGAVTAGAEIACTGISTADEALNLSKVAVAADYIVGVALADAADGEDVMVGINRVSVIKS